MTVKFYSLGQKLKKKKKKSQPFNSCHQVQLSNCEILFTGRNKSNIDISVRKTTFCDKSSFLKIIGDAFRTDYVEQIKKYRTYWYFTFNQ